MKTSIIALFAAASVMPQGAAAAGFGTESGVFAGGRLRIPLGNGKAKPQLGLALAPTVTTWSADGRMRMRFGEGVAFGFDGGPKARLSFGGHPAPGFAPQAGSVDKRNANGISTLGYVGIGLVAVAGVILIADSACRATNCLNSD